MIKGETSCGFKFEIDENQLDDMEFLEALADMQEDVIVFPKVCKMLLGNEQKKALYNHLRDENGKVPIASVERAITEIMSRSGDQVKNS